MTFVQAGSVRLEYFEAAPPDASHTIVFVHGYRSSGRIWHVVQQYLAQGGVRSIAFSNRGAGGSDRTGREEDYTPSQFAADLEAAVDALGLDQFTLLGHSLGGRTVTRFMQRRPERVQTLILLAAGSLEARAPRTPDSDQRVEAMAANWQDAGVDREKWMHEHHALPQEVREALFEDWRNLPPQRLLGPRHDPDSLVEVLASMPVPTLVCCGDRDGTVPTESSVRGYLALPADRRHLHVFHDIDHSPPAENPDELASVLSRFVTNVVPVGAAV